MAKESPLPLFFLGVRLLSFDGVMLFADVFCACDTVVYWVWRMMEGREIEEGGFWRKFGSKIWTVIDGRSGNSKKENSSRLSCRCLSFPNGCLPYLLTISFWGCCLHFLCSESWQWFAEWEENCSSKRLFCTAEYQCLLLYCRLHNLGGGKAVRWGTGIREPFCADLLA